MLILCVLRLTAKSAMISDDELGTLRSWKRREIYNWSCSKLLITLQIARFTASSNYTYKMGTLTIIIINLFIVDDKNAIKNIFISTNVTLNIWLT